ncbi:aminodeoxychorismate synthase component I [Corynebacterium sp. 4HC-13]|uniref:aminodeoxychorismate synthase component I n=1 Tax=Corynebacterium anserum TaxID=2684406 RepID=UPI00163A80BD|nr:aminodeoxychorismate synthase component I [Corynebacterium anserum]MBC2682536.1 aminodeoxychorismate synthase component I [Corynebacterium anserum]
MIPRLRPIRHSANLGEEWVSTSRSLVPCLVEALFPDATHIVVLDSSLTTSSSYEQTQSIIVPGGTHAGPLGFSLTHSISGDNACSVQGMNSRDHYEVTGEGFIAQKVRQQIEVVHSGRGGFYDVLRAGLTCSVEHTGARLSAEPALPAHTEFSLGWIGAFGYELKHHSDWVQQSPTAVAEPHRSKYPDAALLWADRAVIVDHDTHKITLLALACAEPEMRAGRDCTMPGSGTLLEHINATQHEWVTNSLRIVNSLGNRASDLPVQHTNRSPVQNTSDPETPHTNSPAAVETAEKADVSNRTTAATEKTTALNFSFDQDHEGYVASIHRAQRLISAGHTYEVCLTNTAEGPALPDPWRAYLSLRAVSPVPYGSYLRFGDLHVLSASPERFLSVSAGGRVSAKPIKGTRPRSDDRADDEMWGRELRNSDKDRAENLMIVDLLRNDLSMVAEIGSVAVTRLFGIESYSHVHQLVSTIEAQLAVGRTAVDVLEIAFPGGSMTGAPKTRTMELLESLEQRARGLYSGAIGWLGLDGAADLSITIRTLVTDRQSTTFGVGGAIVADSDPEAEWQEILVKASALLEALEAQLDDVT